jgi:hypothetical protein
MPRIPQLREDDPLTPPEAREFLNTVKSTMGGGLQLRKALVDFVKAVRYRNTRTSALTELAYMTASVTNRCHY